MPKDVAISILLAIFSKYGGSSGVTRACAEGRLDAEDCRQYLIARDSLGL